MSEEELTEEVVDDTNDKPYSPQSNDSDSESGDDRVSAGHASNRNHSRRSKLWDHFDKTTDGRVVCRHCLISLAFRGDYISNLRQHLRRKHPITEALMCGDSDKAEPPEMKTETLTVEETGDEHSTIIIENVENQKCRRTGRSVWWKYFRPLTEESSVCLTCHKVLRHATSISNLGKHIQRKHINNNETLICNSDELALELDHDDVDHLRQSDDNDSVQGGLNVTNNTSKNQLSEDDTVRKRRASETHEVIMENIILDEDILNKDGVAFHPPNSKKSKMESDVDQWEASLNKFGLYVASLMKMLPREKAAKFQVQIINRLLQERFST